MARTEKFPTSSIVAAAARIAARDGPAQATMARIAGELGAPTGSIYHRFASRDALLGQVWLDAAEAFQHGFGAVLGGDPPRAAALAAALWVPARVRAQPAEARVLMLHRREDFLAPNWPVELGARARALRRNAEAGLRGACRRLCGRDDAEALRRLRFAVVDAPLAAVLPDLRAGAAPPPEVDELLRVACSAVLDMLVGASPRPAQRHAP